MTDSQPITKKLSTYQVATIEDLSLLKRATPTVIERFGGEYGPVFVRWPDIDGEEISANISEIGHIEVSDCVDDDTPIPTPSLDVSDYGGIQRFQLAERLFESNIGPRTFHVTFADEHPNIQRYWMRVADEAIAALIEEPRNE